MEYGICLVQVEQTLVMLNSSPFELPFSCRLQNLNTANLNCKQPFAVHPKEGVVQPGDRQELHLTFCADHEPVFGITHMFTVRPNPPKP